MQQQQQRWQRQPLSFANVLSATLFGNGLEVAEYATTPEYILAYAAFLCGA
jgi:hypothetical protein